MVLSERGWPDREFYFETEMSDLTARVAIEFPPLKGGQDYEVRIGPGQIDGLAAQLRDACPAYRYAVISDSRVAKLYADRVVEAAGAGGARVDLFTFPEGEANKNREQWNALSDAMLAAGLGRDAAVIALGGGVTGDLAGFVAATYLRGLPMVQIPTTILSMIDSSVGGKTGVDTPAGKNLIGAFHQPNRVIADTDTLRTLPIEQIRSGIAEGVKHGAIRDAGYFRETVEQTGAVLRLDAAALTAFLRRSVAIKAAVVAADEREGGVRKTLNFGHTIGHAVEALSEFRLLHGEAVSIGMVSEARLGERLGITKEGTAGRLADALGGFGLPTTVPDGFSADAVLAFTRLDKKARQGRVEYALIEEIGVASPGAGHYGIPVDDAVVAEALGRSG